MATLHVGFDEAGDFRFDKHGSKYYIFTAAYTYDPAPLAKALTDLRFLLMKQGHDLPSFHCCEDKHVNRTAVMTHMMGTPGWRFAAVVVEKRKINPVLRRPEKLYPKFATLLFRFVLRGVAKRATHLVICTDSLPTGHKDAVAKTLNLLCAAELPKIPFCLYHHPRASNKWIQVADYCAWGVQRKWERGDPTAYNVLAPRLAKTELDVCSFGDQVTYY